MNSNGLRQVSATAWGIDYRDGWWERKRERGGERESRNSVMSAWHDDNRNDDCISVVGALPILPKWTLLTVISNERFRYQRGWLISMLSQQYESSYLFYVTLSFLCNIICYLISVFAFSLVTLSGSTNFRHDSAVEYFCLILIVYWYSDWISNFKSE